MIAPLYHARPQAIDFFKRTNLRFKEVLHVYEEFEVINTLCGIEDYVHCLKGYVLEECENLLTCDCFNNTNNLTPSSWDQTLVVGEVKDGYQGSTRIMILVCDQIQDSYM